MINKEYEELQRTREKTVEHELPKTPTRLQTITGLTAEMIELLNVPDEIEGYEDMEVYFDPTYKEHMKMMDIQFEKEREEEERYQAFLLENANYRDRLEKELMQTEVHELFQINLQYLKVSSFFLLLVLYIFTII